MLQHHQQVTTQQINKWEVIMNKDITITGNRITTSNSKDEVKMTLIKLMRNSYSRHQNKLSMHRKMLKTSRNKDNIYVQNHYGDNHKKLHVGESACRS